MYPEGRCCRAEEMELWVGWGEEREKPEREIEKWMFDTFESKHTPLLPFFFFFTSFSRLRLPQRVCSLCFFFFLIPFALPLSSTYEL